MAYTGSDLFLPCMNWLYWLAHKLSVTSADGDLHNASVVFRITIVLQQLAGYMHRKGQTGSKD